MNPDTKLVNYRPLNQTIQVDNDDHFSPSQESTDWFYLIPLFIIPFIESLSFHSDIFYPFSTQSLVPKCLNHFLGAVC